MATIRNGNGRSNGSKKNKYKITLNLPRTAKLSPEAVFKSVTGNLIRNQIPERKRVKDGLFSNVGRKTGLENPIKGILDYGMDQRAKKLEGWYGMEEALTPKIRPSDALKVKEMLPETKRSFFREAIKNLKKLKRR